MTPAEIPEQEAPGPSPSGGPYTYADGLSWDEEVRAEIIDGELFMMAPPLRRHQDSSGNLYFYLRNFLEGRACRVYAAPFGVRIFPEPDHSDDTVLEPDLVAACGPSKLDDRGCNGPPDLVIEIPSPGTAPNDRGVKFRKYLQGRVREYRIVDTETVHACVLHSNQYLVSAYEEARTVFAE